MNKTIFGSRVRLGALSVTTSLLALALAGCNGNSGGSGAVGGSGDTLATVGGTTISRTDLGRFLEANSGQQALPYLIDTALLTEAAKAKGITVTDAEIAADLARRQAGDPNIAEQIKQNPLLQSVINDQIRRDLTVQRLLTADVKMDDAKLKKYFDTYKTYYDTPAKIDYGLLATSTKARADVLARSLKSGKSFASLVEEQKKAQDQVAQSSTEKGAPLQLLNIFGPKVRAVFDKTPVGGTTPVQSVTLGPTQTVYAIFRVVKRDGAKKADFAALKSTLETDAKMMELAAAEIKKNPGNPQKIEDNLKAVAGQLSGGDPNRQPQMRDILSFILRPAAENQLINLRTNGTVTISDAAYTKVGDQYKAAPAAASGTPGAPAAGGTAAP